MVSLRLNNNEVGDSHVTTQVRNGSTSLVDTLVLAANGNGFTASAHDNAKPSGSTVLNKSDRVPYVNLFKNDRMANANYKLEFVDNGTEKLKFGYEHIDSVEKTYGICLLGFALSGKPPTAALLELVRRWGSNIHFQTHESGWIRFTFPSVEVKERVLSGGNYMVYGHHLFLKEMPRCFRFREEDLTTLPAWVQVHGLPPDCWNFHILSNIVSRIGQPIHVDMLTLDRGRSKFARVLVDIDATKTPIDGFQVELPIGDVDIEFVFELDITVCDYCKKIGHDMEACFWVAEEGVDNGGDDTADGKKRRSRSRSDMWRKQHKSRGRSRVNTNPKDGMQSPQPSSVPSLGMHKEAIEKHNVTIENTVTVIGQGSGSPSANAIEFEPPNTAIQMDKGKKSMECDLPEPKHGTVSGEKNMDYFSLVVNKKTKRKKRKIKISKGQGLIKEPM